MADISKIVTPDGTEYNVKDTTARGLVVANPTLAGTESDLTALQVNGTKYKVPSGGGGGGGSAVAFTVELAWNHWTNDAQTISDARFIASGYSYVVSPATSTRGVFIEKGIYADDVTVNGEMTFHRSANTYAEPVEVNILRVEVS